MTTDEPTVEVSPPVDVLGGRYALGRRLGRGGMGDVYEARDLRLGRTVAVKLLNEAPAADAERFAAEARTLASFAHPHLVRLHDAGEEANRPYLILELIEGGTLAERLHRGRLSDTEAARVGSSVASALAYVHGRGVIHRDVKPGNILVGTDGWIWLADFGIARLVDTTGMTATGTALGTPAYLAPEQVEGQPVTGAADVYALGLVLLESLTGRRAYEGTRAEVTAARLHAPPSLPEGLAPGWCRLLEAMTARQPEHRPPPEEVAARLASETTVSEAPTAVLETASTVPLATPPLAATEVQPAPRRRVRLIAFAVLGALGIGLVLGLLVAHGSPSSGPGAHLAASTTTTAATTTTNATTTTVATTTTTTLPPTTVPSAASAAGSLLATIEADAAGGTLDAGAAQQLVAAVEPLALGPAGGGPPAQAGFSQLVGAFDDDVAHGRVADQAVGGLQSGIDALGTALGVSVTTTPTAATTPTTPDTSPAPPGHGHGHGHGKGD